MAEGLAGFLGREPAVMQVRVASVRGSAPREEGAEMLVGLGGVRGTIGGGQLEYVAIDAARAALRAGRAAETLDIPLGPGIGQCCGGRVRLRLAPLDPAGRAAALARERAERAARPAVLILGAGHVGRALADLAQHLPVRAMLIDGRAGELAQCRAAVEQRLTALPEAEIRAAPPGSGFVVVTHDHALDFLLAAEALARGDAAYAGMIGSASKRAAFAAWARRHAPGVPADALTCPIGAQGRGDKRPEIIAAFTLAEIMAALARVPAPQTVAAP
jgi:xanthine dehydrogenase accessory factor